MQLAVAINSSKAQHHIGNLTESLVMAVYQFSKIAPIEPNDTEPVVRPWQHGDKTMLGLRAIAMRRFGAATGQGDAQAETNPKNSHTRKLFSPTPKWHVQFTSFQAKSQVL
jgi:hypothetical protein